MYEFIRVNQSKPEYTEEFSVQNSSWLRIYKGMHKGKIVSMSLNWTRRVWISYNLFSTIKEMRFQVFCLFV